MSLINEYRSTELAIKELQERLASLQNNESMKKELEFDEKLRALMGEYGKSPRDIITILDPHAYSRTTQQPVQSGKRRERKVKCYKNPYTGEVVETKGGNQKTLKEWKVEHGPDVVESWVQN